MKIAELHLKLHQFESALESYGKDKDGSAAAQESLMRDLREIAAGEKPDLIVKSLSLSELDTPFGYWILSRWLDSDPETATRWIAASPHPSNDEAWLAAQNLVTKPDLFQTLTRELPDSPWKQVFLGESAQEMVALDPRLAVEIAQQMTCEPAQIAVWKQIADCWTMSDPASAIEWMRSLPVSPGRDVTLTAAATAMASSDPDISAQLLAVIPNAQGWTDAALALARNWVQRDPGNAAAWAATVPPARAREAILNTVYREWRNADPEAANAWIESLPDGTALSAETSKD